MIARDFFEWLDGLFRRHAVAADSGWQPSQPEPEKHTDVVSIITATAKCSEYQLQQLKSEKPTIDDHPVCRDWWNAQPVLEPRLVVKTSPKMRERAGHVQEVRPRLAAPGGYPQWSPRDTHSMQRLDSAELDFLHATPPDLPQDAFPIRRLDPASNLLATMRPSYGARRYSLPLLPIEEVPTVKDQPAEIEAYLRALPPWHAQDTPTSVPDAWLNSAPPDPAEDSDVWPANIASMQYFAGPDEDVHPPAPFDPDCTLKRLPLALSTNLLGVTEQDCAPDLGNEEDGTAQASALLRLRFCEHRKEGCSEESG